MKIALLTDGIYPYVLGGMQRHSFFIAKYLAINKVYVDLYHCNSSEYDINKLEFFTDEEKKYIHSIVLEFPKPGKFIGHYLRESYAYSEAIYNEFIKREPVDFIYCKGFTGWKLLEEKKKGMLFPPVGVKFHGLNMFQRQPNFKEWLATRMFISPTKFNLLNADYVFSYGGKITDITKAVGVKPEKIIEIPTGISAEWLSAPIERKNSVRKFIFIGRYERLKGVEEINKAIQLLKKKSFEFHFIGPIPENVKLKSQKVVYHGIITDVVKLKKIISECDVLLCPSYSEGMPNVIIEAMVLGLAIIATDVGAINILVSNNTGWLIPPADKDALMKAMQEAISISNEELLTKKKNAIELIKKNFTWESIINSTIAEIKKRI